VIHLQITSSEQLMLLHVLRAFTGRLRDNYYKKGILVIDDILDGPDYNNAVKLIEYLEGIKYNNGVQIITERKEEVV